MKRVRAIDEAVVRENIVDRLKTQGRARMMGQLQLLQHTVFIMIGGGMLGESAQRSPKGFYIDDRVTKRPYSLTAIRNAVTTLRIYAEVMGFDPTNLLVQTKNDHHNCGVF